jgi:hypothetical protein
VKLDKLIFLRIMPRKQPCRSEDASAGDDRALRTLAEQLRIIQRDVASAKEQASEAKALNAVLKLQLDQQKYSATGNCTLKSKGNQAEYDSNVVVLNELIKSLTALEEDQDAEIEIVIHAAIKALNARNKLIKLANNSSVGWAFVDEFLRSDVAVDEAEDRHIRRCEAAAVEKRRLRQEAGNRGRGRGGKGRGRNHPYAQGDGQQGQSRPEYSEAYAGGYQGYHDYDNAYQYQAPGGYYSRAQNQGPRYQDAAHYQQPWMRQCAAPQQAAYPYQRQLGPCFKCGGPHMVRFCPENDKVTAEVQGQIEDDYYYQ